MAHPQGNWKGSGPINVYLEGDGLPWITRTRIAKDPTPRIALARRFMARDPGPSLYLGRPCYHGLAQSPGCSPWLWTHGRYSEEVVESMVAALRRTLGPETDRELTLIGFSGGGVLAMLIAARMEQVTSVVTIAANLDLNAWADQHGFSRLSGSLNPATEPPLPARIQQTHLAGGRDLRVPADLSNSVAARQPSARFLVIPDFDHNCCWEQAWPGILAEVRRKDPDPVRILAAARPGDGQGSPRKR
jgi:pimeloyl-ACP methyl ester carboxylesterase